jgi:hypothetical protein
VLCLFLDSITCGSRSGIGRMILVPVNHTSRDNKPTSLRPSLGPRNTISKLSSISTVPLEVKMGTSRTVFFQFVFSHGFFKFQLRQLWSKVVVPSVAVEASQCRPHECNHKELVVSVQISVSGSLSHFPPQRVRAMRFVLDNMLKPCSRPAGFMGQQVLDVTRQYWLDSYGNIR